MATQSISLQ